MTRELPRVAGAVQRTFRTTVGKRFSRFTVAAGAALATNQIVLTICLGPLRWTAGRAAVTAWAVAAVVSYLVSRWAWERRGLPNVFKETLPFWMVSIGAAIVLTTATKFANQEAISMGLGHTRQVLFDDAANLLANCVTFLTRFVIFHYVLFADKRGKHSASSAKVTERLGSATPPSPGGTGTFAAVPASLHAHGPAVQGSGPGQAAPGLLQSADTGSSPERGTWP